MNCSVKKSAHRLGAPSSVFYNAVDGTEEILSGYLVKSPPSGPFFSQKSWKRRFFVFYKTSDNVHFLKYYKDEDDRDKPLGGIDLSVHTQICPHPDNHKKWNCIQKMFKCQPDSVLYMCTTAREYFLIGENKQDVDKWFNAIFSVLTSISKAEPLRNTGANCESFTADGKLRPQSLPEPYYSVPTSKAGATCESFTADGKLRPQSLLDSYYSVPTFKADPPPKPEPTENKNLYMPMTSVLITVEEAQSDQNRVSTSPDSGNIADDRNPHDFHFIKREVYVVQENLKNHLTLAEIDGKPCVAHWLGSPDDGCVFHKGDQIIAVNDLRTDSTTEVQTYLNKSLKKEVKITMKRPRGSESFSVEQCSCE
ncbi:pleckstrin homology domain-containing family S member 1-like isoform X2 [Polyodon spathula]|uniref:pleckstrin homology domain-containing family S member 1-like isoform X2 n=1 Tax=Polyodon spathula TaxID=7913 RepID=UPI001B7F1575|nr:pleckstrin homology domain-containing family S member 1-like isoform X2 [Polyodon spathula]